MKKYSLHTELNSFNMFNLYTITLTIIGCLVYTVYIHYVFGIIMWSLILTIIYFVFFKKAWKSKFIEFDEQNIYFEEKKIPLKNIAKIDNGKIVYEEDGEKRNVFFNFTYQNQNLKRLQDFHQASRY